MKFEKLLDSLFGLGYFPIAPATFASLAVILIIYCIPYNSFVYLGFSIILFFGGAYLANRIEKDLGEDPKMFVLDEVLGMIISVIFISKSILVLGIGFILFRIFDILKPPPIDKLENFKNGYGVMLDDLGAGVFSNIILQIIVLIFKI